MWYKVNELKNKGFNKSQISKQLEICRKTVRNYLMMNEQEFNLFINKGQEGARKLYSYETFVVELLRDYPFLSAAQVEDRLKEHYSDFPKVHSKTIYNFIQHIRKKFHIPKGNPKDPRVYQKLPESEYGHYAQVDFGEIHMLAEGKCRKKVYFMAMVLCRSRHKFVYFQSTPFTSEDAIKAHEEAFEYFGGIPLFIIYDQDKVFIVDENMGDILLTQKFKSFVAFCGFKTIFCRKSDPESKGKIENVVKYVKNNFCKGRIYPGDEQLNQWVMEWLNRTANAKVHDGTKQIPAEVWEVEKDYLNPLPQRFISEPEDLPGYSVRKDNTIHYKSNFYTLPSGTYKDSQTRVFLKQREEVISIYDSNKTLLATHPLCIDRGKTIRNTDHQRDKSLSIEEMKIRLLELLGGSDAAVLFIDTLHKDKPRYVRDNFGYILKVSVKYPADIIQKALQSCLEASIYNANRFEDFLKHFHKAEPEGQQQELKEVLRSAEFNKKDISSYDLKLTYSSIDLYTALLTKLYTNGKNNANPTVR